MKLPTTTVVNVISSVISVIDRHHQRHPFSLPETKIKVKTKTKNDLLQLEPKRPDPFRSLVRSTCAALHASRTLGTIQNSHGAAMSHRSWLPVATAPAVLLPTRCGGRKKKLMPCSRGQSRFCVSFSSFLVGQMQKQKLAQKTAEEAKERFSDKENVNAEGGKEALCSRCPVQRQMPLVPRGSRPSWHSQFIDKAVNI